MPLWKVEFTFEAKEDLDKLDKQIRERVIEKIIWLRDNFERIIPLPLEGRWQGLFKLRVGDWRVIYEIEHSVRRITIHQVGHRGKIYKRHK